MLIEVFLVIRLRPLRFVRGAGCSLAQIGVNVRHGTHQQGRAAQRQLQRVHPAFTRRLARRPKDQVGGGQGLHHRAHRFLVRAAWGPNRLIERVEQLEAEAILFARPLDHLAGREQYRTDPVAALRLRALVDEQQARLEHAPQLGP